jgi:hypothetical protein
MLEALLAKLKPRSRGGERSDRASIAVPFLIIAAAVAMLAWRSYQLSLRMERSANTLAVQYAGYAAEITARRVDTAIRAELFRAAEDWQQTERRAPTPTFEALQQ